MIPRANFSGGSGTGGQLSAGGASSGDYPSSLGSGFEPATNLADTPGCVERDEHDPADQNRVIPNSVHSSTVRRASVRVAAQGGTGAINSIRDERWPNPRSDVLPCPLSISREPPAGHTSRGRSSTPSAIPAENRSHPLSAPTQPLGLPADHPHDPPTMSAARLGEGAATTSWDGRG